MFRHNWFRLASRPLLFGLLAFFAACQDTVPTAPGGPQFDISEARFGSGNPDIFFAAPLATNPAPGDAGFDVGGSNGDLVPYVRVCVTDGAASAAGCLSDVTSAVTGSPVGLVMSYVADDELYQVNWRTNALNTNLEYRIEIWGLPFGVADRAALLEKTFPAGHPLEGRPRWLFGWRDVDDSPSTAACTGLEAFCRKNYGQTIPVKVRIEDFVFCPVDRDCAVQFVAAGLDANLQALFGAGAGATSAQLFIPGQAGTNFTLAFEPCSDDERAAVQAYAANPLFGPCVKSETSPLGTPIILNDALTLSYCEEIDHHAIEEHLAFPESQIEQIGVHHFSTEGNADGSIVKVEAWPEVVPLCIDPTSGGVASRDAVDEATPFRWARAVGKTMRSLIGPQPLVALDRGGGGQGYQAESYWMLGLPTRLEYVASGDDYSQARAGTNVSVQVKATDFQGDAVWGAKPTWSVESSPASGASIVSSDASTGTDGISEATVSLSTTPGDNVFHASGVGLADPRNTGCTIFGGTAGASSCNGPLPSTYDPFRPIAAAAQGGVVPIPEDTYLPFTVFGCPLGRGTPTAIDGTLGSGEWQCAQTRTFPVQVSGNSSVQATVYWMNDDDAMHLAVSIPYVGRRNALRIEWDSDGDAPGTTLEGGTYAATRELADDVWRFASSAGDGFLDESCVSSSQVECQSPDADFGGSVQTVGALGTSGGASVYEMSHPLRSGDLCTNTHPRRGCGTALNKAIDLDRAIGTIAGFFLSVEVEPGASGTTVFPGLQQYLKVVLH